MNRPAGKKTRQKPTKTDKENELPYFYYLEPMFTFAIIPRFIPCFDSKVDGNVE